MWNNKTSLSPYLVESLETKMKKIITLIFLVIAAFAYFCSLPARPDKTTKRHIAVLQKALDRTSTIKEIQHKIGAKPDGIIGPNTIALWKKAINDQYAIESFNKMARDTK